MGGTVKAAEWHGFSLDCPHDLELQPVVDASFSYRCRMCGGSITIPWTETIAPMNLEQVREHAMEVLGAKSEQDIPGFTA